MKTVADLKVGDTVWVDDVNARGRPPHPAVVAKIGTKLITVGHDTYKKSDLRANDKHGHGWLILDLEVEMLRRKAYNYALKIENHKIPRDTPIETLKQVAALLGITLEDK